MEPERRTKLLKTAGKGVTVVLATTLVVALVIGGLYGAGIVEVREPEVSGMSSQWGSVTDDSTEIESSITVDNPNPVGVPGVLDVDYEATLNDVTVAEGTKEGVSFRPGETELDLDAEFDNEKMIDWWVSHVNNDERTDVSVTGGVSAPFGVSKEFSFMDRTLRTNVLEGMTGSVGRVIRLRGQRVGEVLRTEATFGEADGDETPVKLTMTVRNDIDRPVTLRNMNYYIGFNDIEMMEGDGDAPESHTIPANSRRQITFTLTIDSQKIDEWWATHVERGERTEVRTAGNVVVEVAGNTDVMPIESIDSVTEITTAFFDSGDEES